MDILPKELFLIILSYTDYPEHIELVKINRVSQNDYLTLLTYRFPEYIRDNIVDYRKDIIYLELLKHSILFDHMNFGMFFPDKNYDQYDKLLLRYLVKNKIIMTTVDLIAYLDDIDILKYELNQVGSEGFLDDLVYFSFYHKSINILNYLTEKDDYKLHQYKKMVMNEYEELLTRYDVLLEITKALINKLYTDEELFRITPNISIYNIDSLKYILDKLPTHMSSELIYQVFLYFIEHSDELTIFVPIWKKYGSQLSKSDYSKLIKQLELNILYSYGSKNVYSFLMGKR